MVPGDVIDLSVKAYYTNTSGFGTTPITSGAFAGAVSSAFGGLNGGTETQQATYNIFTALGAALLSGNNGTDDKPSAYLNYVVFDQNMVRNPNKSGYVGIGSGVNSEQTLSASNIEIDQAGFVYIYLSNESNSANYVYFDNLDVTINESRILEKSDYYPFGLTFNTYNKAGMIGQNFKYNGEEEQDELGYNMVDFGARMYDAAIGRWYVQDLVAESYFSFSPYNYVRNNPILRIDPTGKWDITVHVSNNREKYGYGVAVVTNRKGNEVYRFNVRAEGVKGIDVYKTNANTPTGVYDIPDDNMWIAGSSSGNKRKAYGPNHRLILTPLAGEILDTGRDLIRVHGGRQEVFNKTTGEWEKVDELKLKRTNGCFRTSDCEVKTLKQITDNLEAEDDQEKGGVLIVVQDLEGHENDEEEKDDGKAAALWKGFNNALSKGLDNLSEWLKNNGF